MTLAQLTQERTSEVVHAPECIDTDFLPQYIYGSHPQAIGAAYTQRVYVDIPGVDLIVDLLMPRDGKPLGKRIAEWCIYHFEVAHREWWTPEPVDEF